MMQVLASCRVGNISTLNVAGALNSLSPHPVNYRIISSSLYQPTSHRRLHRIAKRPIPHLRFLSTTSIRTPNNRPTTNMSTSKSAQSLIPSDPAKVMVIRSPHPLLTTFSTPFLRFGRIKVGGRGTLIELSSGHLAIFSPVALTDDVRATVSSKGSGTVKYIIAPDIEHHIFVTPWAKAYPEAEIIGVEGLPEKREGDEATKGIKFHHVYSKGNKRDLRVGREFDEDFEVEFVHSHQNKELALLHKPSKTLIQADLLFNLPATEQFSKSGVSATSGILTKLFGGIMNLRGDATWQKRAIWYGVAGKDRKGFAESVARIEKWDFDRIVPCHGDVIETGGKQKFEGLMNWFKDVKQ
jgi:hypothetical protein